jgi:glycosyltransferase involved in cell wall biosynthesis
MTVRVAIDARMKPGTGGGVETVAIGLAQGFAALGCDDLDLTFVTYAHASEWLEPYLGPRLRRHEVTPPNRLSTALRKTKVWDVRLAAGSYGALPDKDTLLDQLDVDLIHFIRQSGARVKKPFLYHPHDLQHRHIPNFFTRRQIAAREVKYGYLCRHATAIAVGTSWVKQDLITQLGVPEEKVFVVPLAPVTNMPEPSDVPWPADLPAKYVLYPAATWPHKNHAGLLRALGLLRDSGIDVPLVLTGPRPHGVDIAALTAELGIGDLVHDYGYLPQSTVQQLMKRALAVVVPTLFEAASFPIWEAFSLGTPVACSNVTSLPRQVGNAAIVFDPHSIDSIADAVRTLWRDPQRRVGLAKLGRHRAAMFTWVKTAEHYTALYHALTGCHYSVGQSQLLAEKPAL